jgi:hypothetical protein
MPKIDKMLQMMRDRNVNRVILMSDRPFQIYVGNKVTEGSVIPGPQLMEILEEITPPGYLPQLRGGGTFRFQHVAPLGTFDLSVDNFVGTLQISITVARFPVVPQPEQTGQIIPKGTDQRRELYISKGGQNIGPMTPEQAANGVQFGQYLLQDLAIAPHMANWEPLSQVLDSFGVNVNSPSNVVPTVGVPNINTGNMNSVLRSFLNEEQDPAAVARVLERLQTLCTPGEEILYIAVQKRPVVTIAPTSVALTTKRVIIFRPKAMGLGLSFEDHMWRNVGNIHISEEILGSTFSIQIINGFKAAVDFLPKAQARKLYQFGQQMEEQMHSHRRDLMLEEKRAAAGGVNVSVNNGVVPAPAPAPVPAPVQTPTYPAPSAPMLAQSTAQNAPDPVEVLQKLKVLLDKGLISQADYDTKKAEVMSRL